MFGADQAPPNETKEENSELLDHVQGIAESKHRVATAEIRLISLTISHYAADTDDWPGPTPGVVRLSYLEKYFVPKYLEKLPGDDPWGNPYLFWSDSNSLLIVSFGSDGEPDVDYNDVVGHAAEEIEKTVCHGPSGDGQGRRVLRC